MLRALLAWFGVDPEGDLPAREVVIRKLKRLGIR